MGPRSKSITRLWGGLLTTAVNIFDDQNAAMAGRKGSLLQAISTTDGTKLSELRLEVSPGWDGMAAVDGRLYMTMTGGTVRCFTGDKTD